MNIKGDKIMKNKKMDLQLFGELEDEAVDILKEIDADYENMDVEMEIGVAKLTQLKRIADSLEGINESLGALAECVDEVPLTAYAPGYTFLHIGGGVETGY